MPREDMATSEAVDVNSGHLEQCAALLFGSTINETRWVVHWVTRTQSIEIEGDMRHDVIN